MRSVSARISLVLIALALTAPVRAEPPPAPSSSDTTVTDALLGRWEGVQQIAHGPAIEASYVIRRDAGEGLIASATYRGPGAADASSGESSEFKVAGSTVTFSMRHRGGRLDGTVSRYQLVLEGDRLRGLGQSSRALGRFLVDLRRVE